MTKGVAIMLRWFYIILTVYILVIGSLSAYNEIEAGDRSLNAGGYTYDENGQVNGMWDGHLGDTEYSLNEKIFIVGMSFIGVKPFPIILVWATLTWYIALSIKPKQKE